MDWILYAIIGVMIVLFVFAKKPPAKDEPKSKNDVLPYKKRDDFLSASELSFYLTLGTFLENRATICPKVAIKEIVFIGSGVGKDYMKFFNYIAKKHVDFVLCDKETMDIICAIELDDKSHQKEARRQRDAFVDRVFADSQIPLFHIKAQSGYTKEDFKEILNLLFKEESTKLNIIDENVIKAEHLQEEIAAPVCPKCSIPMVKRKARQGANYGKEFYGCSNYPKCREIK